MTPVSDAHSVGRTKTVPRLNVSTIHTHGCRGCVVTDTVVHSRDRVCPVVGVP